MEMIEEAYCSYEVAQLLKEKGFDIATEYVYLGDSKGKFAKRFTSHFVRKRSNILPCPTHQLACAWVREKGLHICVCPFTDYSNDGDGNIVAMWEYWFFEILSSLTGSLVYLEETEEYDTHEEAVESALKYVLTEVI